MSIFSLLAKQCKNLYNMQMSILYVAVLGRQPELGLIELESLLGAENVMAFGSVAILSARPKLAFLGGTIKLARVVERIPYRSLKQLELEPSLFGEPAGKLTFGVSFYGSKLDPHVLRDFSLRLKRSLQNGRSVRYVAPKDRSIVLSAAQLKFNGIPDRGAELIIVKHGSEMILALTEDVQDIDAYAARDYNRPARSAKVGMLPPKLAQLLINTTSAPIVYDPFCGTGVILQEAILMGRETIGSDLATEMIEATKKNMVWLEETHHVAATKAIVFAADARIAQVPKGDVAIVSEGYLGPNLMHSPTPGQLDRLIAPLRGLYREFLGNLAKQIVSGTEVSICAPAWRVDGYWEPLPLVDVLSDLGYTTKVFESSTESQSVPIYGRKDQIVGRALYLLIKV